MGSRSSSPNGPSSPGSPSNPNPSSPSPDGSLGSPSPSRPGRPGSPGPSSSGSPNPEMSTMREICEVACDPQNAVGNPMIRQDLLRTPREARTTTRSYEDLRGPTRTY